MTAAAVQRPLQELRAGGAKILQSCSRPPSSPSPQKIGDVGRLPKMDPVSAQCSKQQLGDFVYLKCFQVFKTSITIVSLITVFENQQNVAFEFINFGIFRQFLSY